MESITGTENILDVTVIEPRLKHPTIFEKFDELASGESLTLHNDHDPKPLYYQLSAERGNIFTWEYLEKGPKLWRVKISKNKYEAENEKKPAAPIEEKTTSATEKNVLNVTALEPRLKHPTIFARFDELAPGESLTIHNDHDPKPLYYQLLGERGNIFTWEYLEQGPQLWRIAISKRTVGQKEETLGEIAAKDLRKAEVFKKYGLDFCCGGKKTLKEACEEKGIDITRMEQELQASDKIQSTSRALPFNDWNLDFLADYIVNTHHSYVKKSIPDLRTYAAKVAKVHGAGHPELLKINSLAQEISDEMTSHMAKEEKILFPFIRQLVKATEGQNGTPASENQPEVESPIRMMEKEHEIVGNNMEQIRKLSKNFELPQDGCASYSYLYKILEEFENDLHVHVHLENNILFPKALALSRK